MNPLLLALCVVVAVAAGWWVGSKARQRASEPKTLAGRARSAATRSLSSLLKQVVSREADEE